MEIQASPTPYVTLCLLEAAQDSRFSFLLAFLTFPSSWPRLRHGQGYLRDLWPGSNKEEIRLPNTSQRIHLKPASSVAEHQKTPS